MMIAPLKWSVHNPYFNYFIPETFYVNNDTSDANSRPLDTYLPDDYIKYKTVTFGSVGFAGKVIEYCQAQAKGKVKGRQRKATKKSSNLCLELT